MFADDTKRLIKFIEETPTCYHGVANISKVLRDNGYVELSQEREWDITPGGKYFVLRNMSSVIAFAVPKREYSGFMITASHSDSPCFKIKPKGEMEDGFYVKLNVERYGGMIYSTWLDRPLSVAGRVVVATEHGIETRLVNIDRDLVLIPSLAIHMNGESNKGYVYNPQVDLLPLMGSAATKGAFMKLVAEAAEVKEESILGSDLFLYNRGKGCIWGAEEEYFSAPRIDDLQCAYSCLQGFLSSGNSRAIRVLSVFDNEEVGSGTKQGAKSGFLADTLERINEGMGNSRGYYKRALASSFMLSADNGHGVHPNHPQKSDPTNRPTLNGGVLIKYNANQKYTTDGVAEAALKLILDRNSIPYQSYVNRSDVLGGSTLGNLAAEKVSVNMADIGLAQLAMHSSYETAGVKDTAYMIEAAKAFYSTVITADGAGRYNIE